MNSTLGVEGLRIVVTGAGSGIGAATASLLAEHGASLGLIDIDGGSLEALWARIRARWAVPCFFELADVSDADGVSSAMNLLASNLGGLDGVFANAGINGTLAPIDEITPDEWDRTVRTNLTGTYLTARGALPHLRASGGGSFVVNSSINGTRCFNLPGSTAYAASKAGATALALSLAVELAADRIRVNVVCPGATRTNLGTTGTFVRNLDRIWTVNSTAPGQASGRPRASALGIPAPPEQVAEVVAFLLGRHSMHMNGSVLHVDGGESLVGGDLCLQY